MYSINSKKEREGKYGHIPTQITQLDHIFINKNWINSIINRETHSSFEGVSFNYRIVSAKIEIRQKHLKLHNLTGCHSSIVEIIIL